MSKLRTRSLAVVTALALFFVVLVDVGTADAQSNINSVDMSVSAADCAIEAGGSGVTVQATTNGTVVGQADAVTVLDGVITLDLIVTERANGIATVRGTWSLDPDGSSSVLAGRVAFFRGTAENAEIQLTGKGRQALKGTSVTIDATIPNLLTLCSDGSLAADVTATVEYPSPTAADGAVLVASANNFADTVATLEATIEGNPNLRTIATVNHSAAAASRGLVLAPTFEIFFGNPALGSPLMLNSDRTTGIDLPQKMVVWQDLYGDVYLSYNAPAYLQSRHDITDAAAGQLNTIAGALAGIASAATGTTVPPTFDAGTVNSGQGLVTVVSPLSFDETVANISGRLEAAPPVNLVFTLDHQANAANVGIDLLPTTLLVFGNPSLGSQLMQANQGIAIDLPQKILVTEDADGVVSVTYNNPGFVKNRHNMKNQGQSVADVFGTLSGALANFATIEPVG